MTARRYQHTRAKTPDTTRGEDWRDRAACVGSEHIYDAAMPSTPYGPPTDTAAATAALALCAACPVRDQCARSLLPADAGWHIAGGVTPEQRRKDRA